MIWQELDNDAWICASLSADSYNWWQYGAVAEIFN